MPVERMWSKTDGYPWRATVLVKGKTQCLGFYASEFAAQEACRAKKTMTVVDPHNDIVQMPNGLFRAWDAKRGWVGDFKTETDAFRMLHYPPPKAKPVPRPQRKSPADLDTRQAVRDFFRDRDFMA